MHATEEVLLDNRRCVAAPGDKTLLHSFHPLDHTSAWVVSITGKEMCGI